MFTGLVTHKSEILEKNDGRFLMKKVGDNSLSVGQSIAHDGACMTVEYFDDDSYSIFVMEESLAKSNFSSKQSGDFFNIEFPLQVGQPLDGHFVSGHIDTIALVDAISPAGDASIMLQVRYASSFDGLVVPKGSITINGVSLTVVDVLEGGCTVWLIPQTQQDTNLGALQIGEQVNIEFDLLGKYIMKWGR